MSKFEQLMKLNVNDKKDKKGKFDYLSWTWAWSEFKKVYPDATYKIERFGENRKPYLEDDVTGYMVFTSVTADGLTHDMWLAVMDFKNQAIPKGKVTMTEINKAIMRCLVKNLAMFGLGLYIYAGEDLPEETDGQSSAVSLTATPTRSKPSNLQNELDQMFDLMRQAGFKAQEMKGFVSMQTGKSNSKELTLSEVKKIIELVKPMTQLGD